MNLTAVTDRDAVLERHIGDSLALLPVIERALLTNAQDSQAETKPLPFHLGPDSPNPKVVLLSDPKALKRSEIRSAEQPSVTKDRQLQSPTKEPKLSRLVGTDIELEVLSDTPPGANRLRVVDVGTGAGLPGLVFAIARPEWELILVESLRKRCTFLEHVVKEVRLLMSNRPDLFFPASICTNTGGLKKGHGFRVFL